MTASDTTLPPLLASSQRHAPPADVPTSTNAQVARQFNTAGTFPYECTVHPGMAGTIVVQ